jgi:hypothetical protein
MTRSTLPSDAADPRSRLPRARQCPDGCDITRVRADACAACAWGLQTTEGEAAPAHVQRIAGYDSQCGHVAIARADDGRIGALRANRFFPGIERNPAFEQIRAELSA